MDVDWDAGTVLYALGGVLGVLTIAYFGRALIFDLSPTVKAVLFPVAAAVFFLAAQVIGERPGSSVGNALGAGAYLVFLGYVTVRFTLSTEQTFILLGASSLLFLLLGYLVRERGVVPDPRVARWAIIAFLAVAAVLVLFDVLGPQPTYDVTLNDTVTVETEPQVMLGTMSVENPFLLSRDIDLPRFEACLYTPARDRMPVSIDPDDGQRRGLIPGGATYTYTLTGRVPMERPRDADAEPVPAVTGTLPVERMEDCPASAESPKIVVTTGDGIVPRPQ